LLLRPANLLLLDEPTNHLDLESKEVLLEALKNFPGTLIFVSHDRYFVDALATRVLEVAAGKVVSHLGNYEDFLAAKACQGDDSHSTLRVEHCAPVGVAADRQAGPGEEPSSYHERKEFKRQERRRQKELAEVEYRIETGEKELADLEEAMADPGLYQDHQRWRELSGRHAALQEEIEGYYRHWEELQLADPVEAN
jgi:ATP-binding cassette subfamily F protein 3